MPSVHLDVRFPCTHQVHVELRGFFLVPTGHAQLPVECPLHGKACTPPRPPSLAEIMTGQAPPQVHVLRGEPTMKPGP